MPPILRQFNLYNIKYSARLPFSSNLNSTSIAILLFSGNFD